VVAIVNDDDAPFLTGGGGRVGYFYLDPNEALRDLRLLQKTAPEARMKVVTLPEVYFPLVRGEQSSLGGDLRLRPSRREVVLANRALQFNMDSSKWLPTSLDEQKGQVPVFYSERVQYEDDKGNVAFPFFLIKADLDAAYDQLVESGKASAGTNAAKGDQAGGIPVGLVRVATLDGLVDQMQSGEVDLSQAVLVGSRSALSTIRQLVKDGSI
jgi:hypothetical protein